MRDCVSSSFSKMSQSLSEGDKKSGRLWNLMVSGSISGGQFSSSLPVQAFRILRPLMSEEEKREHLRLRQVAAKRGRPRKNETDGGKRSKMNNNAAVRRNDWRV